MRSDRYLVWMVILGTVVLLNLPLPASMRVKSAASDNFATFQNGMSLAIHRLGEWGSLLADLKAKEDERTELLAKVAVLEDQVRHLEDQSRQNDTLREQLGFAKASDRKLVLCRVVFRGDTSGWWQTVRLNRGAKDGIRSDMAVITPDGLVGKTTSVSPRSCEVLLMTDPNCKVSCRVARTGAFGIVRGAGVSLGGKEYAEMLCAARPFRMEYVSKEEDVQGGDEIVTTGLGGVFPEGLRVGRVVRSRVDTSGLYQHADIMPAADMASLRHVFVVGAGADAGEEAR